MEFPIAELPLDYNKHHVTTHKESTSCPSTEILYTHKVWYIGAVIQKDHTGNSRPTVYYIQQNTHDYVKTYLANSYDSGELHKETQIVIFWAFKQLKMCALQSKPAVLPLNTSELLNPVGSHQKDTPFSRKTTAR